MNLPIEMLSVSAVFIIVFISALVVMQRERKRKRNDFTIHDMEAWRKNVETHWQD